MEILRNRQLLVQERLNRWITSFLPGREEAARLLMVNAISTTFEEVCTLLDLLPVSFGVTRSLPFPISACTRFHPRFSRTDAPSRNARVFFSHLYLEDKMFAMHKPDEHLALNQLRSTTAHELYHVHQSSRFPKVHRTYEQSETNRSRMERGATLFSLSYLMKRMPVNEADRESLVELIRVLSKRLQSNDDL